MLFCPHCDNILNISKNPPKNNQKVVEIDQNIESDFDDKNNDQENNDKQIENIINKLEKDENIDSLLNDFRLEQIIKHKYFQKLDKKTKSQMLTKLTNFYEKVDDAVGAYYFCKICLYSKAIEPGSLIVSRINTGTSANYINPERLENRKHSKILPMTRNYICSNKKCPTNLTGVDKQPKEAVFFRVIGSMQAWYTCKPCGNYWKGQ